MPLRALNKIHVFCLLAAAITITAMLPGKFAHDYLSGTALHALAFTVLSVFSLLLWPRTNGFVLWTGLAAFGGAIELLQALAATGRMADWNDWIVDSVTAAIVLVSFSAARGFPVLDRIAKNRHRAREIDELRDLIRGLESNA